MSALPELIEQYGLWLVFANVLAVQLGAPLPVYPTLMVVGAFATGGEADQHYYFRHPVHGGVVKMLKARLRDFRKSPLWAQPPAVARGIVAAIESRRSVAYLPWFWRPIMSIIRHIPESVFKKLKL